jgi:Tol biopolymer transport system component
MQIKKAIGIIVFVILADLLSSCSSGVSPIATSTASSTEIPTQIPTNTPAPTPTMTPAPTPFAGISNQLIAFQNEYLGPVFTAQMNGENQVKVTASIPGYVYEWGWSPDGKWLLISTINAKPSQLGTVYGKYITLWLVSPDGSEKHKMGQGFMRGVVWSPDSTHLIFMEDKGGKSSAINTQAYIFNLDTFERKAFLEGIIISNPVYLQDGSLYFNALQEQKGSNYYTNYELFLSPDGSIRF